MLEKAKAHDGEIVILAHTMHYAEHLAKQVPGAIPISVRNTEKLCGLQRPMFIDHFVFDGATYTWREWREFYDLINIMREYIQND